MTVTACRAFCRLKETSCPRNLWRTQQYHWGRVPVPPLCSRPPHAPLAADSRWATFWANRPSLWLSVGFLSPPLSETLMCLWSRLVENRRRVTVLKTGAERVRALQSRQVVSHAWKPTRRNAQRKWKSEEEEACKFCYGQIMTNYSSFCDRITSLNDRGEAVAVMLSWLQ